MNKVISSPAGKGWPQENLEYLGKCPLCGAAKRTILYSSLTDTVFFCSPDRWTMYQCDNCECGYLDPRPDQTSIGWAYSNYFTHQSGYVPQTSARTRLLDLRIALTNGYLNQGWGYNFQPASKPGWWVSLGLPMRRSKQDRMVRNLSQPDKPAKLLDAGCGNGDFLKFMQTSNWQVEGLETDPQAVEVARQNGLVVKEGNLSEQNYPDNHFDVITMSHVIEHLHDPMAELQECYRILRPGGILWLATPNLASIGHKHFQESWRGLEPPRHLVMFSFKTLASCLKEVGFNASSKNIFTATAVSFYANSKAIARQQANQSTEQGTIAKFRDKLINRLQGELADWRSFFNPDKAEELVIIATKPGIASS